MGKAGWCRGSEHPVSLVPGRDPLGEVTYMQGESQALASWFQPELVDLQGPLQL